MNVGQIIIDQLIRFWLTGKGIAKTFHWVRSFWIAPRTKIELTLPSSSVNERNMLILVNRPSWNFENGLGGRWDWNYMAGGVDLLQIWIEEYYVQSVRLCWTWTGLLHQDRSRDWRNSTGTWFCSVNFSEPLLRANEKRFQSSGNYTYPLIYLFIITRRVISIQLIVTICWNIVMCKS